MTLGEINDVIDNVESIIEDQDDLATIKADQSTLDRIESVFNSYVNAVGNDSNLPDPSGTCSVN